MSRPERRRAAERRGWWARVRLEDAADRALDSGCFEVVDGYMVVPDNQMDELIAAHGDEAVVAAMEAWKMRRDLDGRLTYVFKKPKGWAA